MTTGTSMPVIADALFHFAWLWGIVFLFRATRSKVLFTIAIAWSVFLVGLAFAGFFAETTTMPPRPVFAVVPVIFAVLCLVLLPTGRAFMRKTDLVALTAIHVLRIPIEIFLHQAWQQGLVPQQVTWSGTNFDILSGISAAFLVAYLLRVERPSRTLLIAWNIVALGLLVNVVVTALLSFPAPMQQLNLDEPLILVTIPPYILLPGIIVPIVFFAHVAALVRTLSTPQ